MTSDQAAEIIACLQWLCTLTGCGLGIIIGMTAVLIYGYFKDHPAFIGNKDR